MAQELQKSTPLLLNNKKIETKKGIEERTKLGNKILYVREYHKKAGFQVLYLKNLICTSCSKVIIISPWIKKFIMDGENFVYLVKCKCGEETEHKF